MKIRQQVLIAILIMLTFGIQAQIQTYWMDTTSLVQHKKSYFYTNRPLDLKNKEGSVTFKNKWNKKTDNLYFCLFDYDLDSIFIKYGAKNTSDNYPTDKVENNIFYKIYDDIRIKKGIKKISIIIPGYSKTFKKQVYDYMYRLKERYADTLSRKTVILLYAWGDEWRAHRYYKAKRSAKHGANDFAIFQHMLEDFLSDSVFFASHPNDLKFGLTCSSMGNQLLKEYLQQREKQNIPLKKVYKNIVFVGSDASWNSFEKGKGFENMDQLCDSVHVIWHKKDLPLKVSKVFNFRPRMGQRGPRNPETLPKFIKVHNIGNLIGEEDKPAKGHDYLLRNPEIQKLLLQELEKE